MIMKNFSLIDLIATSELQLLQVVQVYKSKLNDDVIESRIPS